MPPPLAAAVEIGNCSRGKRKGDEEETILLFPGFVGARGQERERERERYNAGRGGGGWIYTAEEEEGKPRRRFFLPSVHGRLKRREGRRGLAWKDERERVEA